jgi:hypothetical protein
MSEKKDDASRSERKEHLEREREREREREFYRLLLSRMISSNSAYSTRATETATSSSSGRRTPVTITTTERSPLTK